MSYVCCALDTRGIELKRELAANKSALAYKRPFTGAFHFLVLSLLACLRAARPREAVVVTVLRTTSRARTASDSTAKAREPSVTKTPGAIQSKRPRWRPQQILGAVRAR